MALASITALKLHLDIPAATTAQDALLTQLLDQASAAIESHCQRRFEAGSRTEYYSGDGTEILLLRHTPVRSVTNVWLDADGYWGDGVSAFASADLLVAGTDYALARDNASDDEVSRSGILRRIGNIWPAARRQPDGLITVVDGPGIGNVKVEYAYGYTEVPADLQLACVQLAGQVFKQRDLSLTQEQYEDYSYTRAAAADVAQMLGSVVSLLKPYKKWVL